MNISRNFLLLGVAFLLVGILIGMYMGGSGDHALAPSHAHINLVGFVLPAIFALVYRAYPAMNNGLGGIHFWLHAVGAIAMNVLLFLYLSGSIGEGAMAVGAPISEILIAAGILVFGVQVLRHTKSEEASASA